MRPMRPDFILSLLLAPTTWNDMPPARYDSVWLRLSFHSFRRHETVPISIPCKKG